MFEVEQSNSGVRVSLSTEVSTSWLASSESGQGTTLTRASSMELTGQPEPARRRQNQNIGPRWVPENQGMALVRSQTADVFALRLRATGALVAYQMRANPDIPVDWNILIFPINPRYTKQGVLDGKVGLQADIDYPAGLVQSSDASYFKPIEAYQLKARIDRDEQELATDFAQFDATPAG